MLSGSIGLFEPMNGCYLTFHLINSKVRGV
ncbi:uncharacterized protein METZ01_LOCUS20167 [marine metagenome]|uniref:Uncharacterized protein n=1 Tax=marine metagenome TaxID=408172 RepID=A0A381PPC8_9ZZZZ